MLNVEAYEKIRRAYYVEGRSMRQIAREQGHSRKSVKKAVSAAQPPGYQQDQPREAPVLGPYKERIKALLEENERLPHKQRYTGRRIYEVLCSEGYQGSASGVHVYVWQLRREKRKRRVYIPLEYEPGQDAQIDWGEAQIILNGEQTTVQLFVMRMCYSRKLFVRAYPNQRQECFLDAHVEAFRYFGGVPHRLIYDNLKTAVYAILTGKQRQEQAKFVALRSHYLFESRYCNPGAGHEKGGVEHGVGFARRNFMVPLPRVTSWVELNDDLLQCCQQDDQRQVKGQPHSIGHAWQIEQAHLRQLPAHDFVSCVSREVVLNPYSQVVFETNRYSVPTDQAYPKLLLRAYPFKVEIVHGEQIIASHERCYHKQQDILDPLHYLPLLQQRPGAFEHAQPMRRWRETWESVYEQLLAQLQTRYEGSQGLRQFIQILNLHRSYPSQQVTQAVQQALAYGCFHLDGVRLCLAQLTRADVLPTALDLSGQVHLADIGKQPVNLSHYDQLLEATSHDQEQPFTPGELPEELAPEQFSGQLSSVCSGCSPVTTGL